MTTVYLIRHGQTNNNLQRCCNGCRTDQPLNEHGRAQAASLATYFDEHPVDAVHTSHLLRAKQTAILAFRLAEPELHVEPDLHEVDLGDWDGRPYAEAKAMYPEQWYNNAYRPSFSVYPDGESAVLSTERIYAAFLRILHENKGKRVAIVAHEMILVHLAIRIFGWPLSKRDEMAGICNAGFHCLEIDDKGHAKFALLNYDKHLVGDLWNAADYSTDTDRVAAECARGADLPFFAS